MSTSTSTLVHTPAGSSKKRKDYPSSQADGHYTVKTKKRKATATVQLAAPVPALSVQPTPVTRDKKKDKKKDRMREGPCSAFVLVEASVVVSIPPVFARNPKAGVVEMLDSMVMKYVRLHVINVLLF